VCNFCNFCVDFIIKRDKKNLFKFAALQSSTGIELLKKYNLDSSSQDTFFLIADNKFYTKSTAALIVCKQLSGIIKILYTFIIVPGFIRDFIYDFIAKNRYKFFGKRKSCRIPTESEMNKFLS
jgi:predicted DCC family thiol-disulfide oxidoreductase YuxK